MPRKKRKVKEEEKSYNYNNVLMLNYRNFLILLIFWLTSILLHTFFSGQEGEPFFFMLSIMVIPVFLVISAFNTLAKKLGKK